MRILWLFLLFHCAFAQVGFGTSYLRNSRLCHQWNCVNEKLGLSDSLPAKDKYADILLSLLPAGWHNATKTSLETCYNNRSRKYTNTCPGQALMHCLVDNLIVNCPENKLWKEDGCAPVSSLAANKYMFSQSRYANLKKNIPMERRPAWFLEHYFSANCCQMPEFLNATVLTECGFESFMLYHMHDAQLESELKLAQTPDISNQLRYKATHIAPLKGSENPKIVDSTKAGNFIGIEENEVVNDPLDCCDMKEFINPDWRSECGFQMAWTKQDRLIIHDLKPITDRPTSTEAPRSRRVDVKLVPMSCEQETCVFKKLGIVLESGAVDTLAFSRLLDAISASDPRWTSAKARVETKCLSKPLSTYEDECEINKILACTYDILTENCPDATKDDPCKHSNGWQGNLTCQISSSKFRPRNRRELCNVPDFIDRKILKQCKVDTIMQLEHIHENTKINSGWTEGRSCKEETPATSCLLRKMDVLNKYAFMDYFKTKERIRLLCQGPWYPMRMAYSAAYSSTPLYREHCSTPQKLLNVLDTMLVTCPLSKRRRGDNCRQMFKDLTQTLPGYSPKVNDSTWEELLSRFQHVFLPGQVPQFGHYPQRTVDNPLYRYKYGFFAFSGMSEPVVSVIDLQPSLPISTQKPLILTPVYQRLKDTAWRSS